MADKNIFDSSNKLSFECPHCNKTVQISPAAIFAVKFPEESLALLLGMNDESSDAAARLAGDDQAGVFNSFERFCFANGRFEAFHKMPLLQQIRQIFFSSRKLPNSSLDSD